MDPPSPFELAAAELRALGISLRRLPGEYRVNYRNGGDGTARLAEDLEQAVELGRALASRAPSVAHDGEGHPGPKDQGAPLPFAGAGAEKTARGILIAVLVPTDASRAGDHPRSEQSL